MSADPEHNQPPTPNQPVVDEMLAATYDELRAIAHHHMKAERFDHTLQPTAIVHEAYVRLARQRNVAWQDDVHFKAVASQMIRRILVDYARARNTLKRGGGGSSARRHLTIHDLDAVPAAADLDLLALDDALSRLSEISDVQSRVVELRFFGGLTIPEIADTLGMGKRSVDREWSCAKAWLYREMSESHDVPDTPT